MNSMMRLLCVRLRNRMSRSRVHKCRLVVPGHRPRNLGRPELMNSLESIVMLMQFVKWCCPSARTMDITSATNSDLGDINGFSFWPLANPMTCSDKKYLGKTLLQQEIMEPVAPNVVP